PARFAPGVTTTRPARFAPGVADLAIRLGPLHSAMVETMMSDDAGSAARGSIHHRADPQRRLPAVSTLNEAGRLTAAVTHAAVGVGRFAAGSVGGLLRGRTPDARDVAHEVRRTFEHLGPTYVKLGQLIASSPGVFGSTLSDEFESLLDRVAPAAAPEIRRVFVEELGAPPEEVFAEFDVEPIASASIAQVHTATLHSGEEVVVKIQRPGIAERLA